MECERKNGVQDNPKILCEHLKNIIGVNGDGADGMKAGLFRMLTRSLTFERLIFHISYILNGIV